MIMPALFFDGGLSHSCDFGDFRITTGNNRDTRKHINGYGWKVIFSDSNKFDCDFNYCCYCFNGGLVTLCHKLKYFNWYNAEYIRSKSKAVTFVIGLVAVIFSYSKSNVIPVMIIGYEISVFMLFMPFLMGLYKKNVKEKQALMSMGIGFIFFIIKKIYPFPMLELWAMGISILAYIRKTNIN